MGRVKDFDLFSLIRNFLTLYLPTQRNASENTITTYRNSLDQFISFVSKKKELLIAL